MHQPEVARLTALVLALLFVVPVVRAGWSAVLAGAFLLEFLTHGRAAVLSTLTAEPYRVPSASTDLYVRAGLSPGAPLVLVSAPSDGADATFVYGVNHLDFDPSAHHPFGRNAGFAHTSTEPVGADPQHHHRFQS